MDKPQRIIDICQVSRWPLGLSIDIRRISPTPRHGSLIYLDPDKIENDQLSDRPRFFFRVQSIGKDPAAPNAQTRIRVTRYLD